MAVFFAGRLIALLIIIVLLIVLLSAALFVVPQQQAYIIERFGKFLKVQFAGIHIRIPFVDRIAMKTNMRVNQLNVQLETKTLDNVFVTVVASTQFRVNPNDVATAYAMDSINAAQREKEATRQRAEAQRIQIETQAAAEAEKTRLQGEGQANYRREIANGIVDQIKSLQAVGMNINDVNNVVLFNQYLDVMRSLSESGNAKTVVLPASTPGGYQDLYEQVTKAMLTASETK